MAAAYLHPNMSTASKRVEAVACTPILGTFAMSRNAGALARSRMH